MKRENILYIIGITLMVSGIFIGGLLSRDFGFMLIGYGLGLSTINLYWNKEWKR